MIRKGLFLFLLTVFVLACPIRLFADFRLTDAVQEFGEQRYVNLPPPRLKSGPVRLHPTLRTGFEYDSNVLLQNPDPHDDVIYRVAPGAIIDLPINKHDIVIGYESDMEFFMKDKDARQNHQNQNFFTLADFRFPDWYVNILEKFIATSDRSGTTFTDRIPRIDQSVNPKVGYRFKRAIFEGAFSHFYRNFAHSVDEPFNFHFYGYTGTFYYDLFARLKALVEYQFGQLDYEHNTTRNTNLHQFRAGFVGEVLPNVYFTLKVGPQFRNYRLNSHHDFNSWVGDLQVRYQMRKNLKLELNLNREPVEATFGNVNFYKQHLIGIGFDYMIREAWSYFSDARYVRHDYAEQSLVFNHFGYRHDNHLFLRTGFRYKPRDWWMWELAYQFGHRDSNFSVFDYRDHRVSLSTSLAY